ncbi:MAG: hypothetical protein GY710_14740 [Desulfobacteraceae bacterium]|nr:hypothetical protein [Desulfobacteraceae bacterium]
MGLMVQLPIGYFLTIITKKVGKIIDVNQDFATLSDIMQKFEKNQGNKGVYPVIKQSIRSSLRDGIAWKSYV